MATGISQRINNDLFLWIFLLVCNVLWKFNYMLLYGTVLIACTLLVLSFSRPGKKEFSDITVSNSRGKFAHDSLHFALQNV
jgi:hypothetical protein